MQVSHRKSHRLQAADFLMPEVSSVFAASVVRIPEIKACNPSMASCGIEPAPSGHVQQAGGRVSISSLVSQHKVSKG